MESIPETGHGKPEGVKKSYKNDSELQGFELREWLKRCGLTTLQKISSSRGDLIEVYKIVKAHII